MTAHTEAEISFTPSSTPPVTQYISGFEGGPEFYDTLIKLALDLKSRPQAWFRARPLAGKVFTGVFLNPSLRTRTSFEAAMARLGGHMVTLNPGAGSWAMEFGDNVVMNGGAAEHIKEAAGALAGYSDALGIRAFAPMLDFAADMGDAPVLQVAKHSPKPVISLESAVYHPCQALADGLTMHEHFGGAPKGKKFTLAWATHPKMCGVAVPHSALLAAARLGMHVTVAHPEGYELHAPIMEHARALSVETGGSLTVTDDLNAGMDGAHIIYAKAWGSPLDYGDAAAGSARNARFGDWTVGAEHMERTDDAAFMHCLPVRRNVVVTDAVLDSKASIVQQQAENRMWGQMALLLEMMR